MIYVLSIALQVAGALLLMKNVLSTKRDNVIRRFSGHNVIEKDNNTNEISYNADVFIDTYRQAYLSKAAFLYIAMGYLLGVFGTTEGCSKLLLVIGIVLLTAFFMVIAYKVVEMILKRSKDVNTAITNEDLERLKIKPTMTNISNADIDALFK